MSQYDATIQKNLETRVPRSLAKREIEREIHGCPIVVLLDHRHEEWIDPGIGIVPHQTNVVCHLLQDLSGNHGATSGQVSNLIQTAARPDQNGPLL